MNSPFNVTFLLHHICEGSTLGQSLRIVLNAWISAAITLTIATRYLSSPAKSISHSFPAIEQQIFTNIHQLLFTPCLLLITTESTTLFTRSQTTQSRETFYPFLEQFTYVGTQFFAVTSPTKTAYGRKNGCKSGSFIGHITLIQAPIRKTREPWPNR